jgi:hypothetical protein
VEEAGFAPNRAGRGRGARSGDEVGDVARRFLDSLRTLVDDAPLTGEAVAESVAESAPESVSESEPVK